MYSSLYTCNSTALYSSFFSRNNYYVNVNARSSDKLTSLCIDSYNVCDYQTWQGGDIQYGASLHNFT